MISKETFQSIIIKLQNFWAEHGCLITQPYYTQVGAGTMNPATFLRVLGPEPWNVAYVEPSVRPDDGRYGENPNRFQVHYQYQVILKPDPGNPQELYLESLKALGIDSRQHDIRFVEDNWEQPAIAAWGLGWEVWLDGQEITQFTYFQQVGGVALDPVAVELTYGLERILIALNNAKAIWDELWGGEVNYGEVRRREEFEHSKYYFEIASVARVREMYDLYKAEAEACLAHGLVLPAHDYVLKCSHVFNTLDTRGAIGVTERQAFFGQMRDLARRVALVYLEQRKEKEYPLLKKPKTGKLANRESGSQPGPDIINVSIPNLPSPFLLEIGVEELPANDVAAAYEQLSTRIPLLLDELQLTHGDIHVFSTPRRLTVYIDSLFPRQTDRNDLVKGPPSDKAFDKDGKPTPAAQGFANKNGVKVESLEIREENSGKYVFALIKQAGRPTPEVLSEILPGVVAGIKFDKSMKWNDSGITFSRPIRWLIAMFGEIVISFEYGGAVSGNVTRGLRPYGSPEIKIPSAEKYFSAIRDAGIVLDKEERKASIVEQVKRAAALVGGEAIIEEGLLNEVTNLIEMPTAVMGRFDKEYLSLPRDVLVSVMKKHQRYFPVVNSPKPGVEHGSWNVERGILLPHFIAIRNGDDLHIDLVRQGNEHVIDARFSDADFFVREDIKHPLEYYRNGLKTLTFQKHLGSMHDKSERIEKLVDDLIQILNIKAEEAAFVRRAVHLAKADLTTQMVTEMTSLQGAIGCEYALRSGEPKEVADAIGEHYQPVPKSKIGVVIALADRIDSLVGLFAAGLAPTGAKDPFGLRRAAIGVVQPLIEHDIDFNLAEVVVKSAMIQPIKVSNEVQRQVLEFISGRLKVVLYDQGYKYDVIDAILAVQSNNPAGCARAVRRLQTWVERDDWSKILPGFARCVRITRDQKDSFKINEKAFIYKEEIDLYDMLRLTVQPTTVDELLNNVVKLIPSINAFFDKVLVMSDHEMIKNNRLALIYRVAKLSDGLADLSKLEGF